MNYRLIAIQLLPDPLDASRTEVHEGASLLLKCRLEGEGGMTGRKALAATLRRLADQCERREDPFAVGCPPVKPAVVERVVDDMFRVMEIAPIVYSGGKAPGDAKVAMERQSGHATVPEPIATLQCILHADAAKSFPVGQRCRLTIEALEP